MIPSSMGRMRSPASSSRGLPPGPPRHTNGGGCGGYFPDVRPIRADGVDMRPRPQLRVAENRSQRRGGGADDIGRGERLAGRPHRPHVGRERSGGADLRRHFLGFAGGRVADPQSFDRTNAANSLGLGPRLDAAAENGKRAAVFAGEQVGCESACGAPCG